MADTSSNPNIHYRSLPSSPSPAIPGVFAWVGAILANLSFIALISFGAVKLWPLGCLACGLYSCLLFSLARRFDVEPFDVESFAVGAPEEHPTTVAATETAPIRRHQQTDNEDMQQKKTLLIVSLLYGLAVVALAVAGGFPAVNLFSCIDTYRDENRGYWSTDVAALPRPVQEWARAGSDYNANDPGADFLFLPQTQVTLFSGCNHSDGGESIVWPAGPD